MNLEIANRLVSLRKEHGLSQEKLAEKLGVSRQAISKWERGEASPDTDNLVALAEVYGTTLDALMGLAKEAPPQQDDTQAEMSASAEKAKTPLQMTAVKLLKFPFPLILALVYLIFGFTLHRWHPGWLIFLLIPIYYHLGAALTIREKKARLLAMPVPEAVLLCYLPFGFLAGLWSPTWVIFLLIPLYYWIVACFVKSDKTEENRDEHTTEN